MTTMELTLERAPEIVQEEFYPCLHELFESQADLRGDAPALICGDISLSYIELENTTNRLARYLRAHGVGRETSSVFILRNPTCRSSPS